MTNQPNEDTQPTPETAADETTETPLPSRFPELDELQSDVSRRIRDNQKFLDRFMDDEFIDDDPETTADDGDPDDDFEEL